jgi:hypothetical protein
MGFSERSICYRQLLLCHFNFYLSDETEEVGMERCVTGLVLEGIWKWLALSHEWEMRHCSNKLAEGGHNKTSVLLFGTFSVRNCDLSF